MARHAQPREVAELKGAPQRNPQRYRADPPKNELPLGNAPDHLSDGAKAVWFEVQTYAPPGVLTGAERMMLEQLSELFAEFRQDPRSFAASKHGQVTGMLARLGMSPADRQKLGVEKQDEENPFDRF